MGCASSVDATGAKEAWEVGALVEAAQSQGLVGKVVHVTGFAAPSDNVGDVLHSPFAEHAGVAMIVEWWMAGSPNPTGNKRLFTGRDMVDRWRVMDRSGAAMEVRRGGASSWKLMLKDLSETYEACNVMKNGDNLESGGTIGQISKVEVRPHAMGFYTAFKGGRDTLPIQSKFDHAQKICRPRRAVERVVRLGEGVVIKGTLRASADGGLYVESGSLITPSKSQTQALGEAPGFGGADLKVCYMQRGRVT